MDDSDEYGFDDIDEATFQVIDAIESSHISASQAPKQTSVVPRPAAGPSHNSSSITTTKYGPPLAKRVRTDGWSGTEPSRLDNSTAATTRPATKTPATRTETLDDIPDISVSIDGSYFVAPGKSKDVTKPIPGPSGTTSTKPGAVLQKVAGVQKASGVVPAPPKPSNTAQVSGRGPSNGHVHGPPLGSRPPNLPINKNPVVIPPKVVQSRGSGDTPPYEPIQGAKAIPESPAARQPAAAASADLEALKAQMALLKQESEGLKKSLQQAEDAKMMKEGEASNIRRLMEKQAQTHAGHIETLKVERDVKIAAALKSHESLQSTIDSLKTQLAFKNHDLEASSRKWNPAAGGSAKKRVMTQFAGSATSQTPSRKGFSADAWATTPKGKVSATPAKALLSHSQMANFRRSPSKEPSASRAKLTDDSAASRPAKGPQFAMFHNSFAPVTSPVKKRGTKSQVQQELSSPVRPSGEYIAPFASAPRDDSQMRVEVGYANDEPADDRPPSPELPIEQPLEPWKLDWRQDLHLLLFSHSVTDFTTRPVVQPELTLQILLSTTIPSDASPPVVASFRQGCALILGAFGAHPRPEDWPGLLEDVARGFVMCTSSLVTLKSVASLMPVLKLMESLVISIPALSNLFLDAVTGGADCSLARTLAELILTHFRPPTPSAQDLQKDGISTPWDSERVTLAKATLGVIEAVAWSASKGAAERLLPLTKRSDSVLCLTHRQQPSWLIERSLRVIVVLSSHQTLLRPLLSLSQEEKAKQDGQVARIPILERLCGYLVVRHRCATEAEIHSITQSIFTIFASFTEVDSDGMNMLRESIWVIPSLLVSLMHWSAPVFEEEQAIEDGEQVDQLRLIRTLYYGLHLLWSLVNPSVPVVNLRVKIQQAAAMDPQQFNGLLHLFIVAMGRLSFADPPEWLPQTGKETLIKAGELARDLLDTVVEGPDGDSIWEAFQPQDEEVDGEDLLGQEMAMEIDMDT